MMRKQVVVEKKQTIYKHFSHMSSVMVWWLGYLALTQVARVRFPVTESLFLLFFDGVSCLASKHFVQGFARHLCRHLSWEKSLSTWMGFEPTRAEPIGLAVQRLNHSATASCCLAKWLACSTSFQALKVQKDSHTGSRTRASWVKARYPSR